MEERVFTCLIVLLLGHFHCSGSILTKKISIGYSTEQDREAKQLLHFTSSISTTQKDITTPITTVPTITPASTTPSTTTPIINPTSNPDTSTPAVPMTPITNPTPATALPATSGASWCVATQSAPQKELQVALDYACGYGGVDCSAIQPSGSCYNPTTVRDHASYAFNAYYQKNPVPNSCNFGGTAMITSTDPSTGTCQYASTSTSSSVLNTTNSSGSTVFGAVPTGPSTPSSSSAATTLKSLMSHSFIITCLMTLFLGKCHL
ncbi:hypothetical protein ACB092_06G284800 [Castanea dentata]